MLGENQKISQMQIERQYQLVFFSPLLLFVSKELQGAMGIFALLIAMPIVWLFLVCLKRRTRRFTSKLRVFFYQIFLILAGIFVSVQAGRLVSEYMLQGFPHWLAILMFVLVSLALGSKIEQRARFAQIAYPVVSVLVGMFFFFSFLQGGKMSFDFGGFWQFSWGTLWKNVLTLLIFLSGTFLFPFGDTKEERNGIKNVFLLRMVGKLGVWLGISIVLQYLYFGEKGANALQDPMLDLMSGVKLPGDFVRRLDLIFLSVMLFALLFTMGSICFYSGWLWKKVNISIGRWPVVALILALVLTLSGCQMVEPEKRAYPLVLGIDWTGDSYEIYLAMANIAKSTGQEKSGSQQDANLLVLKGKNSQEIQTMYDASQELYLDIGHVQAVVFGKELLANKEHMQAILLELEQNHDLGNSPYVFCTEQMKELFEKNGTQIESLGDYLIGLYENRINKKSPQTLMQVYRNLHNKNELQNIPELEVSKEKIVLKEKIR